jgi:hypothetical protein
LFIAMDITFTGLIPDVFAPTSTTWPWYGAARSGDHDKLSAGGEGHGWGWSLDDCGYQGWSRGVGGFIGIMDFAST